jgi:hypothetical protein
MILVTVFVDVLITEIVPSLRFVTYATLLGGTSACANDRCGSNNIRRTKRLERPKKRRPG